MSVQLDDGFDLDRRVERQHLVANGASDFLAAALGERGKHARSAVGVAVLPLNAPVEIEAIVELD